MAAPIAREQQDYVFDPSNQTATICIVRDTWTYPDDTQHATAEDIIALCIVLSPSNNDPLAGVLGPFYVSHCSLSASFDVI